MPGLQQRCDDDSSSDDDSLGYQRDFDAQEQLDSGATFTILPDKVNQRPLVDLRTQAQAMMPTVAQACAAMTDDEFKKYKRKMNIATNEKILSKKDFRKGRY
jgi:hypothetical protein